MLIEGNLDKGNKIGSYTYLTINIPIVQCSYFNQIAVSHYIILNHMASTARCDTIIHK